MTEVQKLRFGLAANDIWEKLVKGGNIDVKPVHYAEGAARYVTKELRPETSDRLLLPPHMEKKNNIDG